MSGMAKGPFQVLLRTASGQWIVLGMGAYTLFPEQLKAVLNPIMLRALDSAPPAVAKQFASLENGARKNDAPSTQAAPPAPIIIHTPGSDNGGRGGSWTTTVITYAVGAGACWAGYVVLTNTLPDACKELLPVTRGFFESTAKTLGQGILNVRQVLEEQILGVVESQEELDRKLQENTETVVDIQSELGEARQDLGALGQSLERCESTLQSSHSMHAYTTRGVKLLVRCVANLLPNQDGFLTQLEQFIKEGEDYPDGGQPPLLATDGPPSQQGRRTSKSQFLSPDGSRMRRPSSNLSRRSSSTASKIESMEDIQQLLYMDSPDPVGNAHQKLHQQQVPSQYQEPSRRVLYGQ